MMQFILVIWIHWLADFVLQTDKMAVGKSSSLKWLSLHVATYTACFLPLGVKFALVNGVAHFAVDFLTSKGSRYFWVKGDKRKFFMTIGFDQALHLTILILTLGI